MESNRNTALWKYYYKSDGEKAICYACKTSINNVGGTTTGMIKHLKCKHPMKFEEYEKDKASRGLKEKAMLWSRERT